MNAYMYTHGEDTLMRDEDTLLNKSPSKSPQPRANNEQWVLFCTTILCIAFGRNISINCELCMTKQNCCLIVALTVLPYLQ